MTTIHETSTNDYLANMRQEWQQGDHAALIGPTGSGKTRLARRLLSIPPYVVVAAIKSEDGELDAYERDGFTPISAWPPPDYGMRRVLMRWRPEGISGKDTQALRERAVHTLTWISQSGGWLVYLDDAAYALGKLRLHEEISNLLSFGRSEGITVMLALQRPTDALNRMSRQTLSQVRHKIIFHAEDAGELTRLAQIAGLSDTQMQSVNKRLAGTHDFLAVSGGVAKIVRQAA